MVVNQILQQLLIHCSVSEEKDWQQLNNVLIKSIYEFTLHCMKYKVIFPLQNFCI